MPSTRDLAREAVLFGDLRNLIKLKQLQAPTEDDVRTHAAAVRRRTNDYFLVARDAKSKVEAWRAPLRIAPALATISRRPIMATIPQRAGR